MGLTGEAWYPYAENQALVVQVADGEAAKIGVQ
ncbi:hypothetical protein Vi05172_g5895 [Venturia inaequalis]|nr:hypothetical protein Vi05172_g5895 [Venturia inaequalis]